MKGTPAIVMKITPLKGLREGGSANNMIHAELQHEINLTHNLPTIMSKKNLDKTLVTMTIIDFSPETLIYPEHR